MYLTLQNKMMEEKVQNILVLYTTTPGLDSGVLAWSEYKASCGDYVPHVEDDLEPPYHNAMQAMRDGWRVIQMTPLPKHTPESTKYLSSFDFQTVLERYEIKES